MKDAYESMATELSRLGLYNLDKTNIDTELKAYAIVIDQLNNELNEMLRECFIDTASTYGLENRELIIGAKRYDLSVQKRREMLLLRENINSSSFTVEKIRQSLKSFGIECDIIEYPSLYVVVVDSDIDYPIKTKEWIRREIEKIMPAHLEVQVVFSSITWEYSDEKDSTCEYIDSLNLSWDKIDNL